MVSALLRLSGSGISRGDPNRSAYRPRPGAARLQALLSTLNWRFSTLHRAAESGG
jgi:hypothetical protein